MRIVTHQRRSLTEEAHEQLVEVGNFFYEELGKLTAAALAKMPEEYEDITLAYLQDLASLYGSDFTKYLPASRCKEGT